jgi:phosphoglycerate dehydrogenase-like enzyme
LVKVLVPYGTSLVRAMQEALGDEVEVIQSGPSAESMLAAVQDVPIIVSFRVPGEVIRKAPKLRMIQSFGTGVDLIDRDAVIERNDVIVCNSQLNSEEVAEYAIALLLALSKNLIENDRALRSGDWKFAWGGPSPNIGVRGKTALLLGLGRIGSEIAKRLSSFSVTSNAVTRSGQSSCPHVETVVAPNEMEPLVRSADFIVLALPLTPETEGLVDSRFLKWMKPTSFLVNVARGPIVDEAALYDALKNRRIAGAGIDVWWRPPPRPRAESFPPSKYPFHELDNVVISPHRAAYSESIEHDQIQFAAKNVLRYIRGETPLNIVDMRRGY